MRPRCTYAPVLLALGVGACEPGKVVLIEQPTRLGPTSTTVAAPQPLKARRATRQVCVHMAPARARPEPPLIIVLITEAGEGDTLGNATPWQDGRPRFQSTTQDAPGEVCYWDHGAVDGRAYRAITLQAPDTLTVWHIDWWSGHRIAAP